MLLADFIRQGTEALAALYPEPEARSMMLLLCEERLGVSRHAYLTEPALEVPAGCLAGDVARLRNGEPIQYILGFADFYGRRFNVSPAVLIPRPETEFLCHTILAAAAGTPAVVDLCTGSGCIAWTLAAEIPGAEVTGVDISPEALTVARGQQVACHRAPSFVQADILADPPASLPEASFDLLTANPPYVMDRERAAMRPNVLEPGRGALGPDAVTTRRLGICGNQRPSGTGDRRRFPGCRFFRRLLASGSWRRLPFCPLFYIKNRFFRFGKSPFHSIVRPFFANSRVKLVYTDNPLELCKKYDGYEKSTVFCFAGRCAGRL